MPSNFDCIGLPGDSTEVIASLIEQILPASTHLGTAHSGAETYRWQDPSGARVVIEMRGKLVHSAVPSFAGMPATQLRNVVRLNDDVSSAEVTDDNGEQVTALALDLEQRAMLGRLTVAGRASLVAFVGELTVHADADAFAASPASLLADPASEPPAHFVEMGWPWPPRMGLESFISHGLFESARGARPLASLNGIVRDAHRRTNALTGTDFVTASVATAGFSVDVCMRPSDIADLPQAGQAVAATVYMVGSLDEWVVQASPPERSGWRGLLGRARKPAAS